MFLTLTRLDPTGIDREGLIDFLIGSEWPYHVMRHRTRDELEQAIDGGAFRDDDNDTYWIEHASEGWVGIIRFEDLTDPTPMFDVRLRDDARGKGWGTAVLRLATDHVFETLPQVHRFEGCTRQDNIPMRKTFQRAGWAKESHYRQAWPGSDGDRYDAVGYAILRQDWMSGAFTPVDWYDMP